MPTAVPPVDPNVRVPSSVTKAAAQADAIHAQAYQTPADPQHVDPAPAPAPDQTPAPQPAPQPAPPPALQPAPPAPAPQPAPQPAADRAPAAGDLSQEEWRHRYLAMDGRYRQTQRAMGGMQEQMAELGDELMRLQSTGARAPAPQPTAPISAPGAFLTPEEQQAYGPELLDVIARAARAAVMPDLQAVHSGVRQVSQRVQQVSQSTLYGQLDEAVPNWRAVNIDDRFRAWCGLPDVYSGQLRGRLLQDAFKAGHAARVIAFFNGFLAEERATGQLPDPSVPPPVPPEPPRAPTIPLELLTAPGRAKPAPGGTPVSLADKPVFTRQQIAAFYTAVRQGHYVGRDADKNIAEQQIFAAQSEGRVR